MIVVDRPGTQYPVKKSSAFIAAAKDAYTPKRADGSTKDHPAERMLNAAREKQERE